MKTRKFPSVVYLLSFFVGLTLLVSSCEKSKGPTDICLEVFSAQKMSENLQQTFDGNAMGYAFVIMEKGNVKETIFKGKAQSPDDANINMSVNLDMHTASISKFLTTVLTILVCKEKDISLNSSIGQYLPPDWVKGTGINSVTIAELCNHSAGMNIVGTQSSRAVEWDSLMAYVQAGATMPKTRSYSNTHHAMLRLILPKMYYDVNYSAPGFGAEQVGGLYKLMMEDLVFEPLDIKGDLKPSDRFQILGYTGANDNSPGIGGAWDYTLTAGGFGWHMTLWDLAKFWAYAWHSDLLIDDDDREWLQNTQSGVWNTLTNQKYGTYYSKQGGWGVDNKRVSSVVMTFPKDVQVVMYMNSPVPGGISFTQHLTNAFDDSFVCN